LSILFSSETEDKVDLKSLRNDMQKAFGPSQVELRQIGPRDVAKLLGGMGACGLETRCCSKFLTDFNSISIRMAKEQGISLTPSEITGMCGRLRCCLIYEYQTYCDCRAQLPKRNKRVVTPDGEGKIINLLPLQLSVMVDVVDLGVRTYSKDDIRLAEEGQAESGHSSLASAPAEENYPEAGASVDNPPGNQPAPGEGNPSNRPSFDRNRRRRGKGYGNRGS
jgi:cell fate regulator YaaT (PSP1 superfamily)